MKLLYIHGFASCGIGVKSTLVNDCLEATLFRPDLPFDPHVSVSALSALIEQEGIDALMGSSMGGYYATYLAEKYRLKAILINPSTKPYETLRTYLGTNRRFCDEAPFEWRREYLDALKAYDTEPKNGEYLVLLQSEDEVLDYALALKRYEHFKVVVEYGGNHRFENLNEYLCMIASFLDVKLRCM